MSSIRARRLMRATIARIRSMASRISATRCRGDPTTSWVRSCTCPMITANGLLISCAAPAARLATDRSVSRSRRVASI